MRDNNFLVPSFRSTNKQLTDLPSLLIFVVPDSGVQFIANSNLKETKEHVLSHCGHQISLLDKIHSENTLKTWDAKLQDKLCPSSANSVI